VSVIENSTPVPHVAPPRRGGWRVVVVIVVFLAIAATAGGYFFLRFSEKERIRLNAASLAACKAAVAAQDWKTLQQQAEAWLQRSPDDDDAWLMLGEGLSQQGDPLGAAEALCRVSDRSRKVYAALLVASDLQFGEGNRPLDGVRTLQRLIKLRPDSITARQRLLYYYAVTHQRELLLAGIKDAIAHQSEPPDVYVYLLLADHLGFTNGLPKLVKWYQSNPDSEELRVAVILQRNQMIEDSADPSSEAPAEREARDKEFNAVLSAYPSNHALFRYRCERLIKDFDFVQLGLLLEKAPPGLDSDSLTWRYRGWHAAQTGDFSNAAQCLRRSIELFGMDWHTWQELANVERRLGHLDEAENAAKTALEGKELRKVVVQLPDVRSASGELLKRIGRYAERTGQVEVAAEIDLRLNVWGQNPGAK
jgi:tetratricopeptide (TPR) repeat protein